MPVKEFPIAPVSPGGMWGIVAVVLLLVALAILFAAIALSPRRATFVISSDGIRIKRALYGRTVPGESLDVEKARQVDLTREKSLQPVLRTNGIGLSGYSEGWFKLRNGEKALLFVTDRSRVVYVPTDLGYSLMLSVSDPERFLSALGEL